MQGFIKKVFIADSIEPLVSHAFSLAHPTTADAWLGALAYTVQLYFDFSGYSDMAIGLGLMMGFRFVENFNQPYISQSITEFWRRWHMSLSRSEEHTSEIQSLMRTSYAVFCLKTKQHNYSNNNRAP